MSGCELYNTIIKEIPVLLPDLICFKKTAIPSHSVSLSKSVHYFWGTFPVWIPRNATLDKPRYLWDSEKLWMVSRDRGAALSPNLRTITPMTSPNPLARQTNLIKKRRGLWNPIGSWGQYEHLCWFIHWGGTWGCRRMGSALRIKIPHSADAFSIKCNWSCLSVRLGTRTCGLEGFPSRPAEIHISSVPPIFTSQHSIIIILNELRCCPCYTYIHHPAIYKMSSTGTFFNV